MSNPSNDPMIAKFIQFFEKYDKDKNQILDKEELTNLLKESFPGKEWSDTELAVWFKTIDKNNDGGISLDEFIEIAQEFIKKNFN